LLSPDSCISAAIFTSRRNIGADYRPGTESAIRAAIFFIDFGRARRCAIKRNLYPVLGSDAQISRAKTMPEKIPSICLPSPRNDENIRWRKCATVWN